VVRRLAGRQEDRARRLISAQEAARSIRAVSDGDRRSVKRVFENRVFVADDRIARLARHRRQA
jgi:hypothetical protein